MVPLAVVWGVLAVIAAYGFKPTRVGGAMAAIAIVTLPLWGFRGLPTHRRLFAGWVQRALSRIGARVVPRRQRYGRALR